VYFVGQLQFVDISTSHIRGINVNFLRARDHSNYLILLVEQNKNSLYQRKELSVVLIFPRNIAAVIYETPDSLYNATTGRVCIFAQYPFIEFFYGRRNRDSLHGKTSNNSVDAVSNMIIIINIHICIYIFNI